MSLLQPINESVRFLQRHRGRTISVLSGNMRMEPGRKAAETAAKSAMENLQTRLPPELRNTPSFLLIENSWQTIQAEGLQWPPDENFAKHSRLISDLLNFAVDIADDYVLSSDPSLDSYYLIESSLFSLPQAIESMGQLRAYGSLILARKQITEPQKIKLHILLHNLEASMRSLKLNLNKVSHFNPDLKQELTETIQAIDHSVDTIIGTVDAEIFHKGFAISPEAYFELTTQQIDKLYLLLEQRFQHHIQSLLKMRIKEANQVLVRSIGLAIGLLLLILYCSLGMYHSTMASIWQIKDAALRFAEGDLKQRVQLNTNNELQEVGESFNAMAASLERVFSAHLESLHRTQAIVETARDAVIQTNQSGIIIAWNPYAEQMFGWRSAEIIGKALHETIIPARFRADHLRGWQRFMESGNSRVLNRRIEITALHQDGHEFPIELATTANEFNGKVEFCAFIRDISERIAAEAKLTTLSTAIEQSPTTIFITSADGCIEYVNPYFCQSSGFKQSEILGKKPSILKSGLMDVEVYSELWQTITSGQTWHGDMINRRKDGSLYWEATHIAPVKTANGHISHFVAIKLDVTERIRLEQREKHRAKILELLASGADLQEVLNVLVGSIESAKPDKLVGIQLIDSSERHLNYIAAPNLPHFYLAAVDKMPIDLVTGVCGITALSGQRIIVADLQQETCTDGLRELALKAGIAAYWAEPIRDDSGNILGILEIFHSKAAQPSAEDLELLEYAAHLAGIAIYKHKADNALQLAAMVYQNSSEGMMVTDADAIILDVNPAFTQLTGYSREEALGKSPKFLKSGLHSKSFYQDMKYALKMTGQWRGEIWNRNKRGELYVEELSISTIFNADGSPQRRVAQFSDITQRKQAEENIWRQANFDQLTGLPNRRLFLDRLQQEIKKAHRSRQMLAIFFLDLDRFKEVNDSQGHEMGDALLQETAHRLRACIRKTDTAARLGGDEFTLIITELDKAENLISIAQNILQHLSIPFQLGSEQVFISVSIGITLYPQDAEDTQQLLKNADQAMYSAKRLGRDRYCFYAPSMQERSLQRGKLINDMRTALTEQQFQVYYQPIVELSSGKLHKAEALLRWQHPERGMIAPGEFIPLAEDCGLITPIGEWVFREATQQVALWRKRFHPDFQISINKSPVQIKNRRESYLPWHKQLESMQLPGQAIVAEITEGLLLEMDPHVRDCLFSMRKAGIQVAIDDFGTGYSSLAYLKKFDIDYLKIDQSFTRGLQPGSDSLVLCEAITVMAHKLGFKVIAEGIETEAQRDLLLSFGCDYGQGYLFAKPMPAAEFENRLLKS